MLQVDLRAPDDSKPTLWVKSPKRPRSYERVLVRRVSVKIFLVEDREWLTDANQESLEDFLASHEDLRADLAAKRMRGETLDARESAVLSSLDSTLDRFLDSRVSPAHRAATEDAAEARRLLAEWEDASSTD